MTRARQRVGASVIGAHIDAVDWDQCVGRIMDRAAAGASSYVCLCNVHSVVTARRQPEFGQVIAQADLVAPDGEPVAWCLRHMGFPRQQRISGPDLMWKCCARAVAEDRPIFLYGGTTETLVLLAARLAREFPGLRVAGCHAPPYRSLTAEEDESVVAEIEDSGARIVFVSLGCPKQEAWMAAHRDRVNAVMIGVGAAFDFHAGVVNRAPHWMRSSGLEWLYRVLTEPRRLWRRYLVTNTLFLVYLLQDWFGRRHDAGTRKGSS